MTRRLGCLPLLLLVCCEGTLDAGRNRVELPLDGPEAGGLTPPPLPVASSVEPPMPAPSGDPPSNDAGMPNSTEPAVSAPSDPQDASAAPVDAGEPDAAAPSGPPISAESPIIILNDSATDSWQGELTLLAASTGRINLAGLIVTNSAYWPDVEFNRGVWQQMLDAARESAMRNVPDLVVSDSPALVAPASGEIEVTVPNDSVGGRFIRDAVLRLGTVEQPLVVVTGSSLTDVADAYLLDNTIAPRLVVVASMGQASEQGAAMGGPNGDLDPWAASIAAQRLQFIQNSGYYEQVEDVPEARLAELPSNAFGAWIATKRPDVTEAFAADQIGLLTVVLPGFIPEFRVAAYAGWIAEEPSNLIYQADGCCWLVPQNNAALAAQYLWQLLQDPTAFGG
jgi:hypothetical protein